MKFKDYSELALYVEEHDDTVECVVGCEDFSVVKIDNEYWYYEHPVEDDSDVFYEVTPVGIIVLPCKVGQTVWIISEFYTQPFQTVVTSIDIYEEETVICTLSGTKWRCEDFGKTVFLTKEEAEQAFAERNKQ